LVRGCICPGTSRLIPGIPNCLCILVPVHEEPEEFVERLKRWKDNPGSEPKLEKWYNSLGKDLLGIRGGEKPRSLDLSRIHTLEECERWARENYPHIQFEFEGAHADTIKPTLQQFHKLAQEWPEVAARIKYIGTGRSFRGEYAHAVMDGTVIGLNPSFYGDPRKFQRWLKDDVAMKHHPKGCDTIESIFTHEFGHLVDSWLSEQLETPILPVVSADGTGLVSSTVLNWLDHWTEKKKRLVKNLSRYATKSKAEAFAEVFAAHYHQTGRKGKFLRSFEALLQVVDKKRWLSEFKWLDEVQGDERDLALQRIKDLKERLGML